MKAYQVTQEFWDQLKFDAHGLIPAVIQDAGNGQVLMMAYMNRESLEKSLEIGQCVYYSRSRQELWHKGAASGHFQTIREVLYDCDRDCLLFQVDQVGAACHEGLRSCFRPPAGLTKADAAEEPAPQLGQVLQEVMAVIRDRKEKLPEGSYTTYLFTKGQDKILKKVGEECAETIIGSKNNDPKEIAYEASDLLYHLMVLLAYHGMDLEDLARELAGRR